MDSIVGFLILAGVMAALSAGLTLLLNMWASSLKRRTRVVIASLASAFLVMALPIIILLTEDLESTESLIAVAALIVAGLILAAVICLPIALLVARRIEPTGASARIFD